MGYFLSGLTSEQCWWIYHGGTATGKSTLVSILHGLLGPYARALPENYFLITKGTSDFATANLAGVRLATCVETNEGKRLDVAKIKTLTGGDAVTAALKYENFFTFKMQAKLILATNHAPHVPAGDDALWRRLRVLPFLRKPVAPETRIADLAERLVEEEGSGILRLAVLGSQARFLGGLDEPAAVRSAVSEYRAA
jgi:putative DNA primase/helicase